MRLSIRLVAALVLLAAPALAQKKTEITETGKPHFEAELPDGTALHLHIRSGEIRIVGSDENKIVVDITGKHAAKTEDVKYRLTHIENSESRAQKSSSGEKCQRRSWLEARTGPSQSAELPNEPHLPPNCGHGDPSLTPEGGGHTVVRKDEVEIGNSDSSNWNGAA